jgi:hypothetical protein
LVGPSECSWCHRSSRFQQISARVWAAATRAIWALDRLRTFALLQRGLCRESWIPERTKLSRL